MVDSYRMNFRNWKIVDVDNWMNGNHFFSEMKEEDVWKNEVKVADYANLQEPVEDPNAPNAWDESMVPVLKA